MKYRVEQDTMGRVRIPADRYYGAQTQRAVQNFPVSGLGLQPEFTRAQALIMAGKVYAVRNAFSGQPEVFTIATKLPFPNGVAVRQGDLYVAEVSAEALRALGVGSPL